jgi:hypothetical protein
LLDFMKKAITWHRYRFWLTVNFKFFWVWIDRRLTHYILLIDTIYPDQIVKSVTSFM